MERRDHLWPGGPVFYFSDRAMKPSTDSFLLADFTRLHRGDTVVDLGMGSGLLEVLLLAREPGARITGIELDEDACVLARRTLEENRMDAKAICGDLRETPSLFPRGTAEAVVCNPPYFTPGSGAVAPGSRGTMRAELTATLEEVCAAASAALKYGGRFTLVYRVQRLADLVGACRAQGLEPKRMRLVQHRRESIPELVLLECRKGGHPGLAVEPTLLLENDDGTETEDVKRAYFRDKE